jgi:tetratricopeptide (TPR) repeat protein
VALSRLAEVDLLALTAEAVDAHPLVREYFAKQLRQGQSEAYRAGHGRLFEHLCQSTPERPDTLDGLQPLYQAVAHGCLAGRQQQACDRVYFERILRGAGRDGFYSTKKLGAIGAELGAVAAFFDEPWARVSPNLTEADQAWLLNQAAATLRALGRLTEALQPMRAGLGMYVQWMDWRNAAIVASNLSELGVALGRLGEAVVDARQAVTLADQSGDAFQRMSKRAMAADALHQSGRRGEAGTLFAEAETMQKERQPKFDLIYSLQGFRYCDWLLGPAERAAWLALLRGPGGPPAQVGPQHGQDDFASLCAEVERRATTTLAWVTPQNWLLDIALDHLTLARVGLLRALLTQPLPQPTLALPRVAEAVNGLRKAGQMDHLPKGLLTAALYHSVRGDAGQARAALAEAQEIAERGPMPLHLADVHLHRARLFRDKAELARAAKLIRDLGYGRRSDELADAQDALGME